MFKHTPEPWVPWVGSRDSDGYITCAGVDTAEQKAAIAELMCETIEEDNVEAFNAIVRGDTALLAAALRAFKVCQGLCRICDDTGDLIVARDSAALCEVWEEAKKIVADVTAQAEGGLDGKAI